MYAPGGGQVSDGYGRRFALLMAAAFGVAPFTLIALRFDDTRLRLHPNALRLGTLVRIWSTVLPNPTLLSFTALTTAAYAVLFTFLASASFVFIHVLGHTCGQTGAARTWTARCGHWLTGYRSGAPASQPSRGRG